LILIELERYKALDNLTSFVVRLGMNITARLLQSQILEATSGKRFDAWLLPELDGVKVLFYQYITSYTPNSVGYSFSLTPMSSYTTEELALGFLLVYNPAALGLSTVQAESVMTEMRLLVIDQKPATERKTAVANRRLRQAHTNNPTIRPSKTPHQAARAKAYLAYLNHSKAHSTALFFGALCYW
jgi:hypothetical protein